ncbi:O-antigen ligase family protein [Cytophaga aurantiaca]|uniref:O-antigen ligase family protein n=1 Tax=Cytophaga aurantiaca TaxID=29530 RepID=UPI000371A522|nr:O-antigen ligase family protein [Cytophaga aurantiaca]
MGYYITAFLLPFSANIQYHFIGITLNTPLEPLLLILTVATIYRLTADGLPVSYITHPLSILFFLFTGLIIVSSFFSVNLPVSLRMAIQTIAYIIPAYWGVLYLSKDDNTFIRKLFLLFLFSFSMVCFINFFRHAAFNFNRSACWYIANPFYSDHTIYATMAAFMIPIAFVCTIWYFKKSGTRTLFFAFLMIVCSSGLILSYSRAAMISVLIAFALYFYIRLKISWWIFAALVVVVLIVAAANQETLFMSVKRNQTESKTLKTNLSNQVKSITNVSNDVSNLERLNRWKSAIRMIDKHPFLGFGYGMYQHEYFPYQKASETTQISIRNPQSKYHAGTGGTAHSEYLLLSSENGLFMGITYVVLLIAAIIISIKNISNLSTDSFAWYLSMGIAMSITTYVVHGFFNNFLDTSKISFVFFAFLASITSISIKQKNHGSKDIVSI